MKITYTGPFVDGVEIADSGQWAEHGEPIDVHDELAGRPPVGTPGDADYDPGAGLLAQVDNFVLSGPPTRSVRPSKSEEPTDG